MPTNLPRMDWGLVLFLFALGAGCSRHTGPPEQDNVTLHVAGTVTDQENGAPLPGVTVGLWEFLGPEDPVVKTTTDDAGHYELSTLVERCVDGTALALNVITENLNFCYSLGSARNPACTENPQTFDLPLFRNLGVEGCPWNSSQTGSPAGP